MLKQWLIEFFTRLTRAVLIRTTEDIEAMQSLQAGLSSATFTSNYLGGAKPIISREALLHEAIQIAPSAGMTCEFGVYHGATLSLIAAERPDQKVYGLDSFEGLPEAWRANFPGGTFKIVTDQLPQFADNVKLYRGLFNESLPRLLRDDARPASFLHIDCDLYTSTRCVFELISDRLRPGTVIVFDEYFNYPGWEQHEHRALAEVSEETGFSFDYLFYNPCGQQVAIIIRSANPT